MKIALGTTSEQKIICVKEVLNTIGCKAEIIPQNVSSNVTDQPLTSHETKLGSVNRAKAALETSSGCDFSIGIEFGYELNDMNLYEAFCWATIIDSSCQVYSAQSTKLLLPRYYQEKLKQGLALYKYKDEYLKNTTDPVKKYFADVINYRKPFITDSVRDVLILYLLREEF